MDLPPAPMPPQDRDGEGPAAKDALLKQLKACSRRVDTALSHRGQAPSLAPRDNLDAKSGKREHRPAAVEQHSRDNDQSAWDRTNGGTFPKIGDRDQWHRVDGELAVIRNGLDNEDP